MADALCTVRTLRVHARMLDIDRLDAHVRLHLGDVASVKPTAARVRVVREKTAWTTPSIEVRMVVGGELVDFATPISVAAPSSGSGLVITLPADELAAADGIDVRASAVQTGALASVGFDLDYPAENQGAAIGDARAAQVQ